MRFTEQLAAVRQRNNPLLCVKLDPDPARLLVSLTGTGEATPSFYHTIVDVTAGLVCASKPQIAYFALQRAKDQLERLISYIREVYPGIPVVLDAKHGDIGSVIEHYAKETFERYQADTITVSPYMGFDSTQPYLVHTDKGVIVLCRTSSAGGNNVQLLETDGRPVCRVAAEHARDMWNTSGQMDLMVGATFPGEIAKVREIVGDMSLPIPGVGTQGGDIEAMVHAGHTADGTGMMINSSWVIFHASTNSDFADAARRVAEAARNRTNQLRI